MTKVAILDSGINPKHPHVTGVAGGFNATAGGIEEDWFDYTGHGTAVAGAIQTFAPQAQLYAVKIFDRGLRTNIDTIARGIEWAIEQQVDILNFSLGTSNAAHTEVLQRLVDKGRIWVAAAAANGEPAYPGSLPGVIGVESDNELDRPQVRQLAALRFAASPYPREIPGVSREHNLHGISFAVANVSGLLAAGWENLSSRDSTGAADLLSRLARR